MKTTQIFSYEFFGNFRDPSITISCGNFGLYFMDSLKLKICKAPGSDVIPAECLNYGGEALYRSTHKIIQGIWQEEKMPYQWKEIPPQSSWKYPIRKIEIIGEYQCGFRLGHSSIDQIFTIKHIMEKRSWASPNVRRLQTNIWFDRTEGDCGKRCRYLAFHKN